jgi:hypothetical protein
LEIVRLLCVNAMGVYYTSVVTKLIAMCFLFRFLQPFFFLRFFPPKSEPFDV